MDEKKLHTQKFQWRGNGRNMSTTECSKHLWHIATEKDISSELKSCVRYFLPNFYFSPYDSPSKTEKCFLFHLKSSFCSRDIQIFVIPSSPFFLPISHCFRFWSKKNLKAHDVINCLNKNLIIHFVWYLEKEITCDIKTLSIDWVLNKEHFPGKIMQKMCTKCYFHIPF